MNWKCFTKRATAMWVIRPLIGVLVLSLLASGWLHVEPAAANTVQTVQVRPTAETVPVPHSGDAADDPAIWIHPTDTALSTIVGTDKLGGLAVYNLNGSQLQYAADGKMDNVDLRYNFPLGGSRVALVTAGNRSNNSIASYRVNPATRQIENVAARTMTLGISIYGSCMYRSPTTGKYYFYGNDKYGVVEQWELFDNGAGRVDGRMVRRFDVGTQVEGCVADDELGFFYIGEENVGVWKYGAEPGAGTGRTKVDSTGTGGHLTADVEGLTIYYASNGKGYLIASSQGNNSYVIYQREGANAYVATLQIVAGNGIDAVSGTDGIDVTNVNLGPAFPGGVFVVQDGVNDSGNQNFKLVTWAAIAGAVSPPLMVDTSWDPRVGASAPSAPTPTPTATTTAPTPMPTATATAPTPTATTAPATTAAGAITLRATSTARTSTASPTSLTVSVPAGVQNGDVLIAQVALRGGKGQAVSAPAGWTLVRADASASTIWSGIYARVANGEQAPYTWSWAPAEAGAIGIAAYAGVDPTNPIDGSSGLVNRGTAVTAPSVTTTAANAQLLYFAAVAGGLTVTPPAGMTERWDHRSTGASGNASAELADKALGVAGATGGQTGSVGSSTTGIGQLVALRPVGTSAPAPVAPSPTPTPTPTAPPPSPTATATPPPPTPTPTPTATATPPPPTPTATPPPPTPTATPPPPTATAPAPTPTTAPSTTSRRPYAASSPWNTPIGPSPAYDPQSAQYLSALAGYFGSDPNQYTYPVYEITGNTPLRPIKLSGTFSNVTDNGTGLTNLKAPTLQIPIPAGAQPARGTDAQFIIWNRETGDEWGFWKVIVNADGTYSATNGYHYNTNWSGVPPKGFISRGAGVPYLTGLIRPWEIAQGRIDHAIAFAYDYPTPEYIYPATKSDGSGSYPDMPEGARLQLDPSLTNADFDRWGLSSTGKIIARALQEYGMIIIDKSGHPKVYAEYEATAGWNGTLSSSTVSKIPYAAFRVIKIQ